MDSNEIEANFDVIREARATDDGKACIRLAEHVFGDGNDPKTGAEGRQWISLGLKCDAANTPNELKKLHEKADRRAAGKEGLAAMRPRIAVVADGSA